MTTPIHQVGALGSREKNSEMLGSLRLLTVQKNQSLIFNICPIDFYSLPFDQIFKWCQKKNNNNITKSKGLGGGIFVSLPKPKSYTQLQHKE